MLFQLTVLEIQCSVLRFPIFYEITSHKIGGNCNMFWASIKLAESSILRDVLVISVLFDSNHWSFVILVYFQSCFNHASWWFFCTLYLAAFSCLVCCHLYIFSVLFLCMKTCQLLSLNCCFCVKIIHSCKWKPSIFDHLILRLQLFKN